MIDFVISAAFVATSALWFMIGYYARSLKELRQFAHYMDERLIAVERSQSDAAEEQK
jgi:hypothetical protein